MARQPTKKPEEQIPKLAALNTDLIVLDPDYWFRKRYMEIGDAASELPTVIEYINESLQRASIAAADAKIDVEKLEAETYTRLRQEWSTTYAEKMTEKALEMQINQDETLIQARHNFSVLKSYVSRLQNMQENLRLKLDSMRTVEATRRKLIQDDPE